MDPEDLTDESLESDVQAHESGCKRLSRLQLCRLVASYAPYGMEARDTLWDELKAHADKNHPCEY